MHDVENEGLIDVTLVRGREEPVSIVETIRPMLARIRRTTMIPKTMKLCRALIIVTAIAALESQNALAQDKVPEEFQGDWVSATTTCESQARFRVTETQMTLMNGEDSETYGDIAIAHSFFGPDYDGISVVSIPKFNSDQPFTVFFNADEHKGVTKLHIYQEIQGPTNPQLEAIQAAAKKLANRFPLNGVELKKCAATKEAS